MKRYSMLVAVVGFLSTSRIVYGAHLIELESSYLGNGVFEYTLKFPDIGLFPTVLPDFFSVPFPGLTDYRMTPTNWTASPDDSPNWEHDRVVWETLPYSCTFLVSGTNTTFKLGRMIADFSAFEYMWTEQTNTWTNTTALGYVNLLCLIPCVPAEEDGSPTNYFSSTGDIPVVTISKLLFESSHPVGLEFTSAAYRVSVEASFDLQNWTTVTNLNLSTSLTNWKSPVPLDVYGNFFRLKTGSD
jgi:hypothetical protein